MKTESVAAQPVTREWVTKVTVGRDSGDVKPKHRKLTARHVRWSVAADENPKLLAVGVFGTLMFWKSVLYCARNGTDGFVPEGAVPMLASFPDPYVKAKDRPTPEVLAASLVKYGLWTAVTDGYQVTKYLKWQLSRVELQDAATRHRDGAAKTNEKRWGRSTDRSSDRSTDRLSDGARDAASLGRSLHRSLPRRSGIADVDVDGDHLGIEVENSWVEAGPSLAVGGGREENGRAGDADSRESWPPTEEEFQAQLKEEEAERERTWRGLR